MRHYHLKDHFVFNGVDSLSYDIKVYSKDNAVGAEPDVEEKEIPGMNGTLTIDNGTYKNATQSYSCYLNVGAEAKNIESFKDFLNQDHEYHRLEDTFNPDEYMMAKFVSSFEADRFVDGKATFDIDFNRKPQRWLKSGEHELPVSDGMQFMNPTCQVAKPLIYIKSGTGKITVNDTEVNVKINEGVTVIDCELQDCYLTNKVPVNANVEVEEFPTLVKGINTINIEDGMEVTIVPRWWRL